MSVIPSFFLSFPLFLLVIPAFTSRHSRGSGNPESLEVCLEIRSGSPIKEFGDDSCVEFGDDICVEFGDDKLPIGSPIKDFGDDSCVEFGDDSCVEFGDDKKWL